MFTRPRGYVGCLIDPIEEAPEYLPGYGIVVQRKGNDGFNPTMVLGESREKKRR